VSKRNPLTEPSIIVDDVLSMLTGRPRGTLVSFTEITKNVHDYIKTKGLRKRFCPHCNAPLTPSEPMQATIPG
jgi:hypothetical protein